MQRSRGKQQIGKDQESLQKKIGDIKEIFHVKMCTIKEKNGKNLIEAEEIKKTWQEYTEKLQQKKKKKKLLFLLYFTYFFKHF